MPELDLPVLSGGLDPLLGSRHQWLRHIEAGDAAPAETGQHLVQAAEAAADIQHFQPVQIHTGDNFTHRLRPARGEEPLTPDELQHG